MIIRIASPVVNRELGHVPGWMLGGVEAGQRQFSVVVCQFTVNAVQILTWRTNQKPLGADDSQPTAAEAGDETPGRSPRGLEPRARPEPRAA